MCDITAIRMAGLVVGAVGQHQTARATERAAIAANEDAQAGLAAQVYQEDQAATDQMVGRSRDAMREVGSLNAIFADSGVEGASQARILAEASLAADEDLTTMDRNSALRRTQRATEGNALAAQAQSRINAAPRPSLLGTGLQLGSAYLEGVERNRARTRPS